MVKKLRDEKTTIFIPNGCHWGDSIDEVKKKSKGVIFKETTLFGRKCLLLRRPEWNFTNPDLDGYIYIFSNSGLSEVDLEYGNSSWTEETCQSKYVAILKTEVYPKQGKCDFFNLKVGKRTFIGAMARQENIALVVVDFNTLYPYGITFYFLNPKDQSYEKRISEIKNPPQGPPDAHNR